MAEGPDRRSRGLTVDAFDDFLDGGEPAPKARPTGRKPKPVEEFEPTEDMPGRHDAATLQTFQRPMSITFLCQLFRIDRKTATKRLANLPPVGHHRGGSPLYDFKQAAQFLVIPRVDVAAHIKRMGVNDLPSGLQKDVWDARLKSQQWRTKAGELWPTESVLEVLGEAFHRLKTTSQLWIEQISDQESLPDSVRAELTTQIDGLQTMLHASLIQMPLDRSTRSQLAEVEGTDLDV